MSVFVPVPCCLDDDSFVIELEVWNCDATNFGSLFQYSSGYSMSFQVHINFRIICSISLKKMDGILIGIALNVQIALGSIDIFTVFVLLIHEFGTFFHFFVSSSISFMIQYSIVF